jgi:putative nucleotidyltransferase with HDIG domain
MLSREKAVELVRKHVTRRNLFNHILAVEAIMKAMAKEVGEDEDFWAMAGLLHDADFDETFKDPARHATRSIEILQEEAAGEVPEEILRAIKSHNHEHTGVMPESKMEYALLAADAVSGLIVAAALIIPSKKLADVKADSIAKRFKEKDFARNCNRENMLMCEKAGIQKEKFFEIALQALQGISDDIGL